MKSGDVTGSINRAKAVLDVLSQNVDGASLSHVISQTGFNKTTAHRTLHSLQDIHYVYQDPESRRYFLGSGLAKIARLAVKSDVSSQCIRSMRRLAEGTKDTIFLSIPEGTASLCIRVELGDFPIRTLSLKSGDRLPMGVGSTGQALYAMLPQARRWSIATANKTWLDELGFSQELIGDLVADFNSRGYAYTPGIVVAGMSAIALPIVTESQRLVGAIGIGAINERMTIDRIEAELLPCLRDEIEILGKEFSVLEKEGLF